MEEMMSILSLMGYKLDGDLRKIEDDKAYRIHIYKERKLYVIKERANNYGFRIYGLDKLNVVDLWDTDLSYVIDKFKGSIGLL